jgi:hypothetical protein
MVGLLHQLVYIERGVDHDRVDKIINHSRNAVDTAPVYRVGELWVVIGISAPWSEDYGVRVALRCSTICMKSRAVGSEASSRSLKSRQSNASTSTLVRARTSAVRRVSSRIPISPKTSPR